MGTVRTTSRRLLLAGLGLSLAVHFGVGFVARVTPVARAVGARDLAEPVEMAFITLPPEPDRVELGLEESPHDTPAWLGFVDPTDHQAPESEVEQSALTPLLPGVPAAPGGVASPEVAASTDQTQSQEPEEAPAESEPPEDPAEAEPLPIEAVIVEASPTPPATSGPDQLLEQMPMPAEEAEIDPAELLAAPRLAEPTAVPLALMALPPPAAESPESPETQPEISEFPTELARSEPPDTPVPEPSDAADAEPRESMPDGSNTPPGEGGEVGGEKSASESSATAMQRPVDVRPGRVAAAQGLQITTVRPAWDLTTMALAQPRSPTLVIEFGKDGTVRRARFLPGRSTGETSVDRPLLDAIYRWSAKGEALDRLTDDEDDTVAITMRILLR